MAENLRELLVDEYEILSVNSSDIELDDDAIGNSPTSTRHSASNDELLSDIESLEDINTGENTDTNMDESYGCLSSANPGHSKTSLVSKQNHSPQQSFWSFPGSSINENEVMAPLNDELSFSIKDLNIMDPSNALKFSPKLMDFQGKKDKRKIFGSREKISSIGYELNELKYIVMSGSYKLHFQPFIHKVHERFPTLRLIWIDTTEQKLSWITDDENFVLAPEKLSSEAIRMDFYSTRNDHKISSHRYIEELILPGYLNLGIIPVSPFNDNAANYALTSPSAPCEFDSRNRLVPMSRPESLNHIELADLLAVKHSSTLIRFSELRRRHSTRDLSAKFFRIVDLLWLLLGPLMLIFLFIQAKTIMEIPPSSHLSLSSFSNPGSIPVNCYTLQPRNVTALFSSFWSYFRSNFFIWNYFRANNTQCFKIAVADNVPSAAVASTREEIEEYFRAAAIQFHKLIRQAKALAQKAYTCAWDFTKKKLQSSRTSRTFRGRAAKQWKKHSGKHYLDSMRANWQRGREKILQRQK